MSIGQAGFQRSGDAAGARTAPGGKKAREAERKREAERGLPAEAPAAEPPCLLRTDAVWLARRDEEQRRLALRVRRVALFRLIKFS